MGQAENQPAPKKKGRPRIAIDLGLVKALAALNCTQEEIAHGIRAAGVAVDHRTIKRRLADDPEFKAAVEAGQAEGRISLRRLQFRHAKMPNGAGVNMTIHLSKHWLGETEKAALELSGRVDSQIEVTSARDRITRKIDDLAKRIESRVAGIAAIAGAGSASREPV